MKSLLDDKQFTILSEKIELIIRLLVLNLVKDMKTQKEKILMLNSLRFQPSEIARLLGTTSNTVSVTIYQSKKN